MPGHQTDRSKKKTMFGNDLRDPAILSNYKFLDAALIFIASNVFFPDESEDDDSDGAGILINKPSHTTDGSELVNFNNPFLGSSDWTKQGPGLKGATYPLKCSETGTRTTSGID